MNINYLTWDSYLEIIADLHLKLTDNNYEQIIGISRGGLIPATILSHQLKLPLSIICVKSYTQFSQSNLVMGDLSFTKPLKGKCLLVDEIIDSGLTISAIKNHLENEYSIEVEIAAVFWRYSSQIKPDYYAKKLIDDRWIHFPYEID